MSPGGRALWRQLGERHPVDKALSNIRGPVTAKLCEVTAASQNALFVKSQRSGSGNARLPRYPWGRVNRLNVKSRFHPQPKSATGQLPKGGARLRPAAKRTLHGHWAIVI